MTYGSERNCRRYGRTAPGVGAWTLERSPDLSPESWQQVYLFNGVTENLGIGILSVLGPDSVMITDQAMPIPRFFYRFRPLPEPQ